MQRSTNATPFTADGTASCSCRRMHGRRAQADIQTRRRYSATFVYSLPRFWASRAVFGTKDPDAEDLAPVKWLSANQQET